MNQSERGESAAPSQVASDGGQARCNILTSSSSSSSEEEDCASPPPNKRRRRSLPYSDPRVDSLITQVSYISNFVAHMSDQLQPQTNRPNNLPSGSHMREETFLVDPSSSNTINTLTLGDVCIDYDGNKIIPAADEQRLRELNKIQQFNSQSWKGIRFKKAMQSYIAEPGFMGLRVNEELCHFNKSKDYLASTELLLSSLSNVALEQRHLLRESLQSIVDWASREPASVNYNTLFEKFTTMFGPTSSFAKNSDNMLQIICGKRAECIEIRRERILKEIDNVNLQMTLRSVPPSAEYLFSKEALQPIIQSLGGSQIWLNTPSYLKRGQQKRHTFDQNSYRKQDAKKHPQQYRGKKIDKKLKYKKPFRRSNTSNQSNTRQD